MYLDTKEDFDLKVMIDLPGCGQKYDFYFKNVEGQLNLVFATPGLMRDFLLRILLIDGYIWIEKEWEKYVYEHSRGSEDVYMTKDDLAIYIQDVHRKISVFINQKLPFDDPKIEPNSFGVECNFERTITYKVKTSLASIYTLLDGKEEELFKKIIIPLSILPSYIRHQVQLNRVEEIVELPKEKRIGALSKFSSEE